MFKGCISLVSVDLSFVTFSPVVNIRYSFENCISLRYMKLSNIKSSYNIQYMFNGCTSLISVDLSDYDSSQITDWNSAFKNCNNLKYLNLLNFDGKDIFNTIPNSNNLIICMNNFNNLPDTHSLIQKNAINDCSNICFQNNTILNFVDKKCYYDCSKLGDKFCNYDRTEILNIMPEGYFLNDTIERTIDKCHINCKTCDKKEDEYSNNCKTCPNSKFLDLENCVENCPYGHYLDSEDNLEKCICSRDIKCYKCSFDSISKNLCISCNNNYYPKINDNSNISPHINCYKDLDGHYLDNNIYKPCYSSCKKCKSLGNEKHHDCLECNKEYIFIDDKGHENNCYKECPYSYFLDESNKYICIMLSTRKKEEIIDDFDSLIIGKDPNQTYILNGEDYSIIIKPIDEYIDISTVNINFTECSNLLKKK